MFAMQSMKDTPYAIRFFGFQGLCISMELARDGDLLSLICVKKCLSPSVAKTYAKHILMALSHMHSNARSYRTLIDWQREDEKERHLSTSLHAPMRGACGEPISMYL